jgi:hypothetical protein
MRTTKNGMTRLPNKAAVLSVLGLNQILAWGSSFYLIAILAAPIVAETGWSLPSVIAGPSLGLLCAGMVSRKVGRQIHRSGGRLVLGFAALLFVAGLAGLAHVSRLPEYFLAWGVIGVGMGCGLYDAAFATLGRIYGAKARGAITSLTLFGGFASTICWPITAWLAAHYGWRNACLSYAAVHAFVSLPLILWIIPKDGGETKAPGAAPPVPVIETAPDRRRFLLLAASLTLASGVMSAVSVHVIGLLVSVGIDAASAVLLAAAIGPSQVAARLIEAGLQGRAHPVWTLIASVALAGMGVALLAAHAPLPALALIAYGAGNGLSSIARGTMPLALFGPDRYAIWMGRLGMSTLIASAVAPYAASYLIEAWGPRACLAALTVAMALAVLGAVTLAADLRAGSRRDD